MGNTPGVFNLNLFVFNFVLNKYEEHMVKLIVLKFDLLTVIMRLGIVPIFKRCEPI